MNKKSFISDISFIYITQLIVTILGIIVLKLLSQYLNEETFGAYMVVRRIAGIGFPLITMNLGISLARLISFDATKAEKYFLYSLIICTGIVSILAFGLVFFKDPLSQIIYGDSQYSFLMLPTVLFLYAYSFQAICSGYFRGSQDFKGMNLVNISFNILALITIRVLNNTDTLRPEILSYYIYTYSTLSLVTNWIYLLYHPVFRQRLGTVIRKGIRIQDIKRDRNFFEYGISRLPSGFFFAAIFFIPLFVASTSISLVSAAYLGILVAIVRIIQLLGFPFNLIILPRFSSLQSNASIETIRRYSQLVIDFILTIPLLCGAVIFFLSHEIIILWFGERYSLVGDYLLLISPVLGVFLGYIFVRGILDGISDYPYVNYITLSGVTVVAAFSGLSIMTSWGTDGLVIAFSLGLFTLGLGAVITLVKLQQLRVFTSKNLISLSWVLLIFFLFHVYTRYVVIDSIILSLIIKLSITGGIFGVSLMIYKYLQYEWVVELKTRFQNLRSH